MVKTLYIRIVGTFLLAVFIGIAAAFFFTTQVYHNRIHKKVENEMISAGNEIIRLCKETAPKDLDHYLNSLAQLKSYDIYLYSNTGEMKRYGSFNQNKGTAIDKQQVEDVLNGKMYQGIAKNSPDRNSLIIGLPFQIGTIRYAMFIQPDFTGQYNEFNSFLTTVFLILLIAGSISFFIAARYLVKPIRLMTEATKKMAKGDFNVKVSVKQKDELGVLAESFNQMAHELKRIEQMRQDFITNVSHEIQSPLTSIRGFSIALKNNRIAESERQRYLDIIVTESERLSRLSKNLLSLASLESDHHPFHPKTFRLDEQLRRVIVASEPQWSQKNIEFHLTLPRVRITADEDQLNQVWTNLISNSIKFTPQNGHIRVEIKESGNKIKVIISDTGIGISAEDQKQIFQRFYKADKSRNRTQSGSGLGLAIVKKIVELHRGHIEVQSEEGKGTTFIVSLPRLQIIT
ncbi:two-component sensor histidine kinase [Collibacillus ludicampi]|uniref:Heme sensor protein HssS n=1 Tax=Collibacillus ludicampi TaxID=2771369 RepID=A0AAV4LFP5_9BACL|nr:HAMP domain-containing sensor histidine kinase [Collibacillus ludicampi]GIM46620.1 two-component sensor histidine kinase [Collibacillus ludicampi]